MKTYTFATYDERTGEITSLARGPRAALNLAKKRLPEGMALFVGDVDPERQFLPEGVPTEKPRLASSISAADIKWWAGRLLSYTDWYVTRQHEGGPQVPEHVLQYRQAVRDRSGEIEAMEPIPTDYRDPKWWPEKP